MTQEIEQPKITPWNEKDLHKKENFVVFKATRFDVEDGKGARAFKKGESISLSGNIKKDAYFQNKIMYPKDYEAVVKYEEQNKKVSGGSFAVPVDEKSSTASAQNAGSKK